MSRYLVSWWYANYWTNYVMAWLFVPLVMEYLAAGEFTFADKFYRSVKNNIPWYIMYFVIFVVLILILAFSESGRQALAK